MRARPPTPPGGGLVRLDTAGPFRSLPGKGPGGSDPRIRTAAAAAEPSGGVLWGLPLSDRP